MIARMIAFLRQFARSKDGSATIEFVIIFPVFMLLIMSAAELGIMMSRQVMLERAVDLTVRDIRLSTGRLYTHQELKDEICGRAAALPDCIDHIKVEMIRRNPRDWSAIPPTPDCVDIDEPGLPSREFLNGNANDLMIIRACVLFEPIIPSTGLGFALRKQSGKLYALTATSAFVLEPK